MTKCKIFMNYIKRKDEWVSRFSWRPLISSFKRKRTTDETNKNLKHLIKKEGKAEIRTFLNEVNSYICDKDGKLSNKISRRIKTIPIYKIKNINGTTYKCTKRVGLSQFKRHFGLSKDTAPVVGFTPNYIGYRAGSKVKSYNLFKEWLSYEAETDYNNIRDLKYFLFIINTLNQNIESWNGAPDTNTGHLKQFFKKDARDNITPQFLIDVASLSNWFQHVTHPFTSPSEMYWCMNFNPKASNGLMTSLLLGEKNKGATKEVSLVNSIALYRIVRKEPTKNFALWTVLSREKQVKVQSTDEDKLSTRCVWCTEEAQTYLLSWMSNFALRELCVAKDSNFKAPVVGDYDYKKANKISTLIDKYDYIVDADWSFFDSTIDQPYLIASVVIIFSEVASYSPEHMRLCFYYVQSLICKYLALPPGIVVCSKRGNPSGHPGVTLINCVVNMLRWAVIGYEIYGANYGEMMEPVIYGDDSFILFKQTPKLFEIDEIIKVYGYVGDPIVDRIFPAKFYWSEYEDKPDFLKRQITTDGIIWTPNKILKTLIHQSKSRNIPDQIEMFKNFIITAPNDIHFLEMCKRLSVFLRKSLYYTTFKKEIDSFIKIIDDATYNINNHNPNIYNHLNVSIDAIKEVNTNTSNSLINIEEYIPNSENAKFSAKVRNLVPHSLLKALLITGFSDANYLNLDSTRKNMINSSYINMKDYNKKPF